MKKIIASLFLIAVLAGAFITAQPTSAAPTLLVTGQKMAVPSYFYPGAYWTQLENGAPTVGLSIINPNSGPGRKFDQKYFDETKRAQVKGILVIGYVYTNYGSRLASKVKADIDKYYNWYGVDGIFFDEVSTSCTKQSYYLDLYNYVKAKGGVAKVVINPGINTPECYITTADIIVNFEDNYAAYVTWAPSGWEFNYPADRFWHLVIGTTATDMPNAISLSKQRNAGWVYVTSDNLSNPWDTLPADPYWTNELTLISQ